MKTLNFCEFCERNEFTDLFNQWDKNLSIKRYFKMQECKNCGIVFLNPQPSINELKEHYSKDKYYSLGKITKGLKSKIRIFFYNLYYNKSKKVLLQAFLSPLRFYFRSTKVVQGAKILDVGAGSGQFLYEMKKLGMKTYGVEPGEFDKRENLNIINSNLIDANYPSDFFDVITMNHVLEHINNPNETLKEIYRLLKRGGSFIVAVPNINSFAASLFGKEWYQWDVPRHLFNYSDKLLPKILRKEGFKVRKIRYNSRPSQFAVSLMYALNINIGKNKILSILFNILFLPLTYIVNLFKLGDQIEIYCKK